MIPESRLSEIKISLRQLVQERTSAPWVGYGDEEVAQDDYDLDEIEGIRSVGDVVRFLGDIFPEAPLIEFRSCIDYRDGFSVEGKEFPDEEDEDAFRDYLEKEYGVPEGEL